MYNIKTKCYTFFYFIKGNERCEIQRLSRNCKQRNSVSQILNLIFRENSTAIRILKYNIMKSLYCAHDT